MRPDEQPSAEIVVHHPRVWRRLATQPLSLAFGEAYRQGEITVRGDMRAVLQGFYQSAPFVPPWLAAWRSALRLPAVLAGVPASRRRAIASAQHHYDIGDAFYRLWLDDSLTYSCAYFRQASDSLEQAQQQKLDLICRKLRLAPGHTLLDIGCGWGSLLFKAVADYGVGHAVGITASAEQARYITTEIARRVLTSRITVVQDDWRSLAAHAGTFDRIASVGFFEHVGLAHYRQFFHLLQRLLSPDGQALLHTIGHITPTPPDVFITRYIFPGGYLPALPEIISHASRAGLLLADVENLRPHYALTLHQWHDRFASQRAQIQAMLGEKVTRTWELYLLGAEAGFRWGDLHLWQLVMQGPHAPWPLQRTGSPPAYT